MVETDEERAARLAAVQAPDLTGLLSFRPTLFRGTAQDSITIQAWCSTIAKAKTAAGWSDQRALDCATENLREEAAVWYANTKNGFRAEQETVTTTWTAFDRAIQARFILDRTAIQKVNLIRDLHQTALEKVASFYDRVHMAVRKTLGDIIPTMTAAPGTQDSVAKRDAYADGVEEAQRCVIKLMFLAGLKDDLRQALQATADFETLALEALRTHTIRIEDSRSKTGKEPPKMTIAAIKTTDSLQEQLKTMQKEIAAVSALNKDGRRDKRGAGTAPGARKRIPIASIPVEKRTTWIRCHSCKQWGLHMARECPRSASEIASMQPQDDKVKPTTQPTDSCFPSPN